MHPFVLQFIVRQSFRQLLRGIREWTRMSDSAWIMGPECKTVFIVKVYTMHNVEVGSILLEAGDIVAHLAFIELSPGLFFTYTHQ